MLLIYQLCFNSDALVEFSRGPAANENERASPDRIANFSPGPNNFFICHFLGVSFAFKINVNDITGF